jgi:hypothetical protein
MQKTDELMRLEHMTDSTILRAIRYLDPDLSANRAGEDAGTVLGIFLTLTTVLTGALVYIDLYLRTL